jgi:DNA-binding CsgD family transcriptional regulator
MKSIAVNTGDFSIVKFPVIMWGFNFWRITIIALIAIMGFVLASYGQVDMAEPANMTNKTLAFAMVLILGTLSFLVIPPMQKKSLKAGWADDLPPQDIADIPTQVAEIEPETEKISVEEHLYLTTREQGICTMLLDGRQPKEIAYSLKISYSTVNFHTTNLYRKLKIQSRSELFSKFRK